MSVQKIAGLIEGYGDGLVQSASAQLESGLAEVMASATQNFGLEGSIPYEINVTARGNLVDATLSIHGAWRRALHENPRFRGYKFLERAWLEHRDDLLQQIINNMRG